MRKLFGAIRARRIIPLDRFIHALGIRHVGETTARLLARGYGSWTAFHDTCVNLAHGDAYARHQMDALGQVGDTVIESLAGYFREAHNRDLVERLTDQVHISDMSRPAARSPIAGKTVVFTGALDRMTREEAEDLVAHLGATAARAPRTPTMSSRALAPAPNSRRRALSA